MSGKTVGGAMLVVALIARASFPAAAAPDAAPPAPITPPASDTQTVVVTGQRPALHKCETHDQVCVTAVIRQIWIDHPDEVRAWCLKEDLRLNEKRFLFERYAGPGDSPVNTDVPEGERQLCAYGANHKLAGRPAAPDDPR